MSDNTPGDKHQPAASNSPPELPSDRSFDTSWLTAVDPEEFPPPHKLPVGTKKKALYLTLSALAAACIVLGVVDFSFATSLPDKAGSAVWLAAGLVAVIAAVGLCRKWPSWIAYAYVALILAIVLALPVIIGDFRSPVRQLMFIVVAGIVIVLAGLWLLYLKQFVPANTLSKFGAVTTALLAATGAIVTLATTWYSTDYLPRTSIPKVDLTAELTEVGRTGSILHLAAKITVANEGALTIQPFGSLMRVMGYPGRSETEPSTPENLSRAIDFNLPASGEYRQRTVDYRHRELLYSDDFISHRGVLPPGANIVYQRIIDVDSTAFSRVRMQVTASFFNQQFLDGAETCGESVPNNSMAWYNEVSRPQPRGVEWPAPAGATGELQTLCFDWRVAPRSAYDWMVADRPRFRNVYVLQSPCPAPEHTSADGQAIPTAAPQDPDPAKSCPIEVPYFYSLWWNARTEDKVQDNKYDRAYPNITLPRSTEYVITAPPQPK